MSKRYHIHGISKPTLHKENPEVYRTEKVCKCGNKIEITYDLGGEGRDTINALGGNFRSGTQWPNFAYCSDCQRRHDLSKFKRLPRYIIKFQHYGEQPQTDGIVYPWLEDAEHSLHLDAEILKGYHKRYGWRDARTFVVYGPEDISLTVFWISEVK